MTRKATDQIGANNLQRMMDEAERAYDGGLKRKYAFGGIAEDSDEELLEEEDEEIKKTMLSANRMPSVVS